MRSETRIWMTRLMDTWNIGFQWSYYVTKFIKCFLTQIQHQVEDWTPMAVLIKASRWTNRWNNQVWSVRRIQIWRNMFINIRRERVFKDLTLNSKTTWGVWWSQMEFPTVACKTPSIKQMICDVHWVWSPNNGGRENEKILTFMKILYFVVSNDHPLLTYIDQYKINIYPITPNMSYFFILSSYANVISTMRYLDAVSQNLYLSLTQEVKTNLIYSILIDKSTDRTCKPHLIVYVCYLTNVGSGSTCMQFVELMPLLRRILEVMFQCTKRWLQRFGFDLLKLVAIATNEEMNVVMWIDY